MLVSTQSKCLGRKLAEFQGIILEVILVALKENDKPRESGKHLMSNSHELLFPWRTSTMTQTLADLLRPVNCAQSPSEAQRKAGYALHSSVHDVCCHIKCIWKCLSRVCHTFIVLFIFSLHDLYLCVYNMQILFFFSFSVSKLTLAVANAKQLQAFFFVAILWNLGGRKGAVAFLTMILL